MTAYYTTTAVATVLIVCIVSATGQNLRFANYYGDHMVLQRAPQQAVVWGYLPECDKVTVEFNGATLNGELQAGKDTCKWKATLPATASGAGGPYTITASSAKYGTASIKDVIFGDVWICSGQSNMQFTVPQAFNASDAIKKADQYSDIRLFTVQLIASEVPKEELMGILQPWQVASSTSVNGSNWGYFSATCWFFAANLYDTIKVPLGMVATSWGGTRIEAWSTIDSLNECGVEIEELLSKPQKKPLTAVNPNTPTVLWNSMIHPFLNMSIFGAIWYQGEANTGGYHSDKYACMFPAMINDWRKKWSNEAFPFGFVQLAPTGNENGTVGGFPVIRWAQTANYGYVPNPKLQHVFMAVSTDLGDPTSPFGSIHPRDKEDVGARLAMAGAVVAYGMENIYSSGPIATQVMMTKSGGAEVQVEVEFKNISSTIKVQSKYGFELGCINSQDDKWLEGTISSMASSSSVSVGFPPCPTNYSPKQIRYNWRQDPCTFKQCAVYSGDLPSPPFVMDIATKSQ